MVINLGPTTCQRTPPKTLGKRETKVGLFNGQPIWCGGKDTTTIASCGKYSQADNSWDTSYGEMQDARNKAHRIMQISATEFMVAGNIMNMD